MADAAAMLSGSIRIGSCGFALLISWPRSAGYKRIADVLKWLVLVLFAYPLQRLLWG